MPWCHQVLFGYVATVVASTNVLSASAAGRQQVAERARLFRSNGVLAATWVQGLRRRATYCQVGQRGYLATMILLQSGFQASNIGGGYKTFKLFYSKPM